jgi:hypothetical protein
VLSAWLTNGRLRLALLLAALVALAAYGLTTRSGALGALLGSTGAGARTKTGCPSESAPPVQSVSRATQAELREALPGVMAGRGHPRLYEQGPIRSTYAWSDAEPGKSPSLAPPAGGPGAYELRWWASNNDDVVADVYAFASARQARAFFRAASSTDCRTQGAATATSSPPDARDLAWQNPDGVPQEDVYLLRARRVYHVGVVRASSSNTIPARARSAALELVNNLACALPGAGCEPQSFAKQLLSEQEALLERVLSNGRAPTALRAQAVGECQLEQAATAGEVASARSPSLYYDASLGVRLQLRVYASEKQAARALQAFDPARAVGCLGRSLASTLRSRYGRVGRPRERFAPVRLADGARMTQVEVPVSDHGRSYALTLDGALVREGRVVEGVNVFVARPDARLAERLAWALATLAELEQE